MPHRKKLIEVALPLEAINEASAREKSIRHGHPSTLHLWWARRPLAAARAVIFTSLVDDPDDPDALPAFVEACKQLPIGANVKANGDTPRMRLFDFIEKLVTWEATTDEKILNTARELIQIATEGNPPPLLDPFAGGGSIPLEAQRLGLEAHASDLNPVAVMINKAQIEIPPRFANMPPINPRDRAQMFGGDDTTPKLSKKAKPNSEELWRGAAGLAADVRYYGEWMREKAWERIGHLYPTHNGETVIAWIWARTVKSPNPAIDAHVPLARSFMLSRKKGREIWIKPIIENGLVRFEVRKGDPSKEYDGTVSQKGAFCIISGEPITFDYIRDEGKAGRMGAVLMAIATEGQNGRNYYAPTSEHVRIAESAHPKWSPIGEIPEQALGFRVQLYGMNEYKELFSLRQLVALTTFSDLVKEARKEILNDALISFNKTDALSVQGNEAVAYSEAVSVFLSFVIDKLADQSSTICPWSSHPAHELVVHMFARQAIPMTWDYGEINPFSSAASWEKNLDYLGKAIANLAVSVSVAKATQNDARNIASYQNVLISTDPPYYDNIGYADLSDFFYVWMRHSLREVYPDVFATVLVPKESELIASQFRHGDKNKANKFFEKGLRECFEKFRGVMSSEYPLTLFYAFKQQDADSLSNEGQKQVSSTGWETMLTSLILAGFSIDGTWPMRTERPTGVKGKMNALASSILLVCRPRPSDSPTTSRRAFLDDLRRELPAALKAMQSGNIAPVDLAQASIGPGMAIYSRYSKVLEADGSSMSVRTALGLINAALDEYLAEQDGDIDADTRFAVSWFTQFGFNEGEFGQADVLARAKNTSVAGVETAGVVVSGRGKVKLKHWMEYDPGMWDPTQDKRPTVWEATHHLIERLLTPHSDTKNAGEQGAAMLMQKMPSDMAAEARQLAYRLYSICERKGWADHARDYNALVISWSGIGEETARLREAAASGDATTQPRLFEDTE